MAAAARKPDLRVVAPGEKRTSKAKPKRMTVTAAAASGTKLELLIALRTRVAVAVQDPKTLPRDLAALTLRLEKLATDIDVLMAAEAEEGESGPVDDEAFDAASL